MLQFRALVLQNIRAFFIDRGYLETDTPVLSPSLIPETCLEVFKTEYLHPWSDKTTPLYLVPSPEVYIKQLLAQHHVSMFQLSKCFRNVESIGRTHSPEFSMLEYYTVNCDYRYSIKLTQQLFAFLIDRCFDAATYQQNVPSYLTAPWEILTMNHAFEQYAGFPLVGSTEETLFREAEKAGCSPAPCSAWDDLYEMILVQSVEPNLPQDHPVVLIDYPSRVPCLAKDAADGFSKERWELYIRGIELANCYTEATDPGEIQRYMTNEAAAKEASARVPHNVDREYHRHLMNFPPCSGVALGVDRLIMLLADKKSIDTVLPFPQMA